ncbi:MAG: hypothetical protein ACYDHX_04915 [Methanothrix sp.]
MRKMMQTIQLILCIFILIPCMCDARDIRNVSPNGKHDTGTWVPNKPSDAIRDEKLSNSSTDFVADAFDKLKSGRVLYTVPNETRVGDTELVEVRITRNITDDLYKDLHSRGVPQLDKIKSIGTRMRPELRAENGSFHIDAQFSDVTADRPIIENFTEWDWDIIALKDGPQKLKLDVYTVLEIPPYDPYYYPYPVFEKTIVVRVNPYFTIKSFLVANWQWLISLLATFYLGRQSKEMGKKWRNMKLKK